MIDRKAYSKTEVNFKTKKHRSLSDGEGNNNKNNNNKNIHDFTMQNIVN